jgi:hypothetical protein
MLAIVKIAGLVQANPNPKTESNPPANPRALLSDLLNKFSGTTGPFPCYTLGLDALLASSIGGFGLGQSNSLFCVTIAPLTTSSFKSILN